MITLLTLALACGPKDAPVEAAVSAVSLDVATPLPTETVTFAPPEPTVLELAGGGTLWLVERPGLPLVSLRLMVPGGRAADPADQPGLVQFSDDMLTHGAGDYDAQAFAQAMDQLAIDLGVATTDTHSVVTLDTHAERLGPALDLVAAAVLSPRFEPEEVDRVREIRKGDLAVAMDSPRAVAGWVSDRVWYGADHPLAHPRQGTEASLASMTADGLRASWEARRASAAPQLVVVGDVTADALTTMLDERFGGWQVTGEAPAPVPPAVGVTEGPALYMVDNAGSSQTMLQVVMPGPAVGDEDLQAARLAGVVLGGTFTSRLNRLLREEKGYSYGAFARVYPAMTHGVVVAGSAVQRDVTAPALVDMLAELDRLQEGLTVDEITKARGSAQTDLIDAAANRSGLADSYASLVRTGRGPDAFTAQVAASALVTPESALAAMADTHTGKAAVIVVGDLAEIQAAVQQAVPGDWTVVDKLGNPVE